MAFTATVTGTEPITYTWTFGGAGTVSGADTATPSVIYDAVGTHTLTLAVQNACGIDDDTLTVRVRERRLRIYLPVVLRTYPRCTEQMINGGFELDTGWEIPVTEYSAGYTTGASRSGARAMRIGIVAPEENVLSYSSVTQTLSIPGDPVSVTLRFHLFPMSDETSTRLPAPNPASARMEGSAGLSSDVQYVLIRDQQNHLLGAPLVWQRSNSRQWTAYEIDLNSPIYTGRTVTFVFGVYNDGYTGVTGLYVDDVSLNVCCSAP
jgi:PKD repeat protein